MLHRLCFVSLFATLAGCAAQVPVAPPAAPRPLEVLQGDASLATARSDLIATARDKFGAAAVDRALAAPTHLLVKRFAGMVPPPPPGADPDWRPATPAALLIRESSGWLVATPSGWRAANAGPARELDRIITDAAFWREPAFTPACPDYGAQLLLLRTAGKAETVRNSQCSSQAAQAVEAALAA